MSRHSANPSSRSFIARRRSGFVAIVAVAVAVVVVLAGCGSSSSTTSTSSTDSTSTAAGTTTTTGPIQAKLQSDIDNAVSSCRDAASQISNTTLSNAAAAACDSIDTDLTSQLDQAMADAKGNAQVALQNLASDCRAKAQSLGQGADVVGNLCDAISAAAQGG